MLKYVGGYVFAVLVVAGLAPGNVKADQLQLSGIYLGGPTDALESDQGSISGLVGVRHLYLDYRRSFNFFGSIAIATDSFSVDDDFARSSEVEELPSGLNEDVEGVFAGFFFSGGVTYNTNSFDNVILNLGVEAMVGNTYVEATAGEFLKISDQRIGLVGGVTVGFEKFFAGVDFSTNTESLRLSVGISY